MTVAAPRPARLVDAPVGPTLVRLTVPMIFGLFALVLFGLADTWFVGLLGTRELAALGFTFPVTLFVTYLGVGLGIGTSALVARSIGAGDHARAARIAADSVGLACVLVVALAIAGSLLLRPLFNAMGAPAELQPLIAGYMHVYFAGAPLVVAPMVIGAALRANGDTRTPSKVMLGAAGLNAVLDPLFIFGPGPLPGLGLPGAALATVTSWTLASAVLLYALARREHLLDWRWEGRAALFAGWGRHLALSGPAAAANMMTPLANGIITAMVARHGHEAVAAWGVATRIEAFAIIAVLAMSLSLPPFLSQNFGAGRQDRVREAVALALRFAVGWGAVVYVLIAVAAGPIAGLFTREAAVATLLAGILLILPLGYGCQGVVILANSSFNALHEPRNAVVLSVVRWFVCYVPCALAGAAAGGLRGLFAGAVIGNLLAAALAWTWISRHCRRLCTSP